jgi:hypothetical protein
MANLDFIVDDAFRESLTSDLAELEKALERNSLKAAHVLAGSIVEAVLIDYLISEGIVDREAGLKLDLGGAIEKCKEKGVISGKTADLSSAIRSYRNLIHPGRAARLQEKISIETAVVANSVVSMVLSEIAELRKSTYGLTAQQIVAKIEKNSGAEAILGHLIKETKPREIEKLLLILLPKSHANAQTTFMFDELPYPRLIESLCNCFRIVLDHADMPLKKKVANRFVEILRTESTDVIQTYEEAFFRANDLSLLEPATLPMVRDYFFGAIQRVTEINDPRSAGYWTIP